MRTTPPPDHPPVSRRDAFLFWLKLGIVSFGGPAGQIAIMHEELVERRRWISEQRFMHALNYCMLLPGPEAQQLATYVGWLLHRTWGGIVAGALFVLPSLAILIGLSWVYVAFGSAPLVQAVFYGVKPAVAAVVLHAAYRIAGRAMRARGMWLLAAAAFVALLARVPFPAVVLGAAVIGMAGSRLWPATFRWTPHAPGESAATDSGNDAVGRASGQPAWRGLARVAAIGAALWAVPMALLAGMYGTHGTLPQMGWFFTKAAFLTFGGAYAVLPYVYLGAVETHGWLAAEQMIDGLALGESTPGPLIMIVAFVAFLGGAASPAIAAGSSFLAGALAAIVVTWFTFLPSFVLILGGAPFVEASRGLPRLTSALTAITAAVVGMIVNLAVFFGTHVLWPAGLAGPLDWRAAVLLAAAAAALFGFRRGILEVIGAAAILGLGLSVIS